MKKVMTATVSVKTADLPPDDYSRMKYGQKPINRSLYSRIGKRCIEFRRLQVIGAYMSPKEKLYYMPMTQDGYASGSPRRKQGLLKYQLRLVNRKDSSRYDIAPFQEPLSFEKGFFIVVRVCQLLANNNDGMTLIGIAGPSGAGKTVFTEKIQNYKPSIAVLSMDNYNDASRIVDGNFDDPRLTNYDTLLQNLTDLKAGKDVEVPIYDFKTSSRVGYRKVEVPSSRIVIIEGIYALSEKLRPFLDLRASVTGGVHFHENE